MLLGRSALFALSILATAAIVASPDALPSLTRGIADDRPAAGREAPAPITPVYPARSLIEKMQPLRPESLQAVPTFLDATSPRLMAQQHVAGTAIVVVHDGRIIFLRGYGQARLNPNVDVDPARTRFRIGSVTKPLTALAVLRNRAPWADR